MLYALGIFPFQLTAFKYIFIPQNMAAFVATNRYLIKNSRHQTLLKVRRSAPRIQTRDYFPKIITGYVRILQLTKTVIQENIRLNN